MADDLAGGCFDRCGSGPGREPVAVGEPGHIRDVGQNPGCHDGPDAGQVHQRRPGGDDHHLEFLGQCLDLLVHRDQLGQLLDREPAPGLSGQVRGRTPARIPLACKAVRSLALPGVNSDSSRCNRLTVWIRLRVSPGAGRRASAAPRGARRRTTPANPWSAPQRPRPRARRGRRSYGCARCRTTGPRRQLRGHVEHVLAVGQQPLRQRPPSAVAALHRPHPRRPRRDLPAHRGVPTPIGTNRPVANTVSRSSRTSIVADNLWGSTPMNTLAISSLRLSALAC